MSFFRLLSLVLCLALLSVFAPAETSAALKSDATAKQKVQAENRKASVDEKLSELEKKLSAREAENEAAENEAPENNGDAEKEEEHEHLSLIHI